MFRNKLYRYGDEDGKVPAHLHFGKDLFNKMVENKDLLALINSETEERITYGELAVQTASIAVSLTRIGIRKGDVISVCSEKRLEVLPCILGAICAGAVYSPADVSYGKDPLLHRVKIAKPKVLFCSKTIYDSHKVSFDSVGCVKHYVVYDTPQKDGASNNQSYSSCTTDGVSDQKSFEYLPKDGKKDSTQCRALNFSDLLRIKVDLYEFMPIPVDGANDNLFILFSSGTTGLPKGVPLTHLSFLLNYQRISDKSYKGKSILITREWYLTYGLLYTLACLQTGATLVFDPANSEHSMLKAIEKYKINIVQTTPSSIAELVKSPILDNYDVTSIKYLVSSSMPVLEDLVNSVKARLPNLVDVLQLYGMSEAGAVCSEVRAPKGSKPGSSGVPTKGFIIKVIDLMTRQPLGPNERGEIFIKGPSVLKRYLDQELELDEEGFLSTGDVGYYDDDGYFFIVNRIKELIKFNDLSIAPVEFESLLLQHSAVQEAGVVGAPHPRFGEVPVAFVVLRPGASASEQELQQFIDSRVTFTRRLAGGVRFVEKLPRGAGRKLDREELKRMLTK